MKGSFNSNYYLTTATVIPILYIAVIAQFPMIDRIVTHLTEITARLTRLDTQPTGHPRIAMKARFALVAIYFAYIITFLAVVFIILASVQAELQSILALYNQSGTNAAGVLHAVILLIVASLLVPIWTVLTAYSRLIQSGRKRPGAQPPT